MIDSFGDKETAKIWRRTISAELPVDIQQTALRNLQIIHAAKWARDLAAPAGNRLEKLTGDRKGQWSIRINDQWRVCFHFKDGCAADVSIVDYH